MPAHTDKAQKGAKAVALVAIVVATVAPRTADALRVTSVQIELNATVVSATGGSFTTPTPGGGTTVRHYAASEIPSFYWSVGTHFGLSWSLSPSELAHVYGHCSDASPFPEFPFAGLSPGHLEHIPGPEASCDGKLADQGSSGASPADVYEFGLAAIGPRINLETGAFTLSYSPHAIWEFDYCCAYFYDYLTDSFVGGPSANLPHSDNAPFYATGKFDTEGGTLSYHYAIDPLGTDPTGQERDTALAVTTALIEFDVDWSISITVPEPPTLSLMALSGLLLLARRRRL